MAALETHTFDSSTGIFIPHSTICSSCGGVANLQSMYIAKLYRTSSRATIIVASMVTFNVLKVGIPRCKKCASLHQDRKLIEFILFLVLGSISALLVFKICKGNMDDGAYIFFITPLCIMAGLFLTTFGAIKLAEQSIKARGAIPEIELKKEDSFILKLMGQGWDIIKPSAR